MQNRYSVYFKSHGIRGRNMTLYEESIIFVVLSCRKLAVRFESFRLIQEVGFTMCGLTNDKNGV